MSDVIKIIPFGGVRENGKNMYAVEIHNDIYILDCGLKYPENELLGIDIVIPDFSYLVENKDRIVGVFLTHGHADAIGALPYFLKEIKVPVFGSEMTIALAKITVNDDPDLRKFKNFHVVDEKKEIDFGDVTVSFFKTTHTIPDSLGIVLDCDEGRIVYTGDFKFDQTATDGYATDFGQLAQIGTKKVIALLSDSANAENFERPSNETEIAASIAEIIKYHEGRVVVASVASNILRIQQVIDAAVQSGRKVVLTGHDLEKIVNTAIKLNKINIPDDDLIVPLNKLDKLAPEETIVLETGKLGEPIKALQKMASRRRGKLRIEQGDLVLIATNPSHAMETTFAKTKDMLYRAGAEVKSISDRANANGHASRNDLQLMLNLIKPQILIPIQGEYRLLAAHQELAEQVGMKPEQIFIVNKGDVLEYQDGEMFHGKGIEVGNTMIDGIGVGDIGNIVLRDRKILSEDGVFVAVVTIDRKKKIIIKEPKITSKGFVYVKASGDLIEESSKLVKKTVQANLDNKEFDWGHLKQDVRDKLGKYLYDQTKRRPVILPVIMEVNQHHKKAKKVSKKK
ncbi:ribonuclease J [Pediococcus acidilactici]|uniref:ribonuclease J n=1 Tax=Pediococcus acidilactici TaxID=1254 RepID=UPI001322F318|nr:ribonuclease J [Pediococcus acidilactici]KAF0334144.1 RNase J family beta-CASP ribonuclease [Pediococcus acidilactici]KAF0346786.1 RNase J family beta-CASP ribonuclease [Pediococcus acidilactici]KAF0393583.1 RNase J family beta-CASP ribonuclease [Pediococcus acidilactici]KAF0396959.1 RNase J family beta-CASP ribonuclease [Pediococcus acidilactici]KAF0409894.1 RNase J family beta-CASP ribonuclease [Pediococcus acidilactici]